MSFESKRNLRPAVGAPQRKLAGVGYELDRVQRNIEEATERARALPHAKGRKIKVPIQAGATYPLDITVSHGLGRKPVGYHPMARSAPCDEQIDFSKANSRTLVVNLSAEAELELWVF